MNELQEYCPMDDLGAIALTDQILAARAEGKQARPTYHWLMHQATAHMTDKQFSRLQTALIKQDQR